MALIVAMLAANLAFARANGEQSISFFGALADGQAETVTVKEIEALGLHEFSVYNPFELREDLYTGVFVKEFVEAFGADDIVEISATAIDDYTITFSREEWLRYPIVFAIRVNGEYIGFDKKGPMRVIFPEYDPNKSEYQELLPKWMWMITQIEFKK
ncbi:MAG: hypothetical protein R3256_01180 [Thalassovita sp.]|nr:hypothetical protein [Thalassovita sp.]